MKALSTRPTKLQPNPTGIGFKAKGSPTTKENTSTSSKYLNLLKRRDEGFRDSPKTDGYPTKTLAGPEHRELKDFNKVLNDSRKANTPTNRDKVSEIRKELLVFNTGNTGVNAHQQLFLRSEADYNPNSDVNAMYKAFRSPPVNNKMIPQNNILSSYNSTGKSRTRSPIHRGGNQASVNLVDRKSEYATEKSSFQMKKEARISGISSGLESSFIVISDKLRVRSRCNNHPEKKSKYYVKNDESSKSEGSMGILPAFCSSCTFNLVKSGHACEEIVTTGEQFKKTKLNSFVEKLKREKENCDDIILVLDNKSETTTGLLSSEMKKIDTYFDLLIDDLNAQRNAISERLISTFNNSSNVLIDFRSAFADFLSEFNNISHDIDSTYNKIIKNSEIEPFNQILDNYKERINEFRDTNKQLEKIKLFNEKVLFGAPAETLSSRLLVKFDIHTEYSKIIDTKKIDLSLTRQSETIPSMRIMVPDSLSDLPIEDDRDYSNNIMDESFKKSALSKSDVNVSFDKDFQVESNYHANFITNHRESKGVDSEKVPTKLTTALDRISSSQTQMNSQYLKLLGLMKKSDKPQFDENPLGEPEEEPEEPDQNIFEFDGIEVKDMMNKQTPDLSGKSDQPEYLKDYFQALNNNQGDTDIRMNIKQNIINRSDARDQFRSQKVLFE